MITFLVDIGRTISFEVEFGQIVKNSTSRFVRQ